MHVPAELTYVHASTRSGKDVVALYMVRHALRSCDWPLLRHGSAAFDLGDGRRELGHVCMLCRLRVGITLPQPLFVLLLRRSLQAGFSTGGIGLPSVPARWCR